MSYVRTVHQTVEQCLSAQFPKAVLDNVLLPYVDLATIILCIFTHEDATRIEKALNSMQCFADYICLLDFGSYDDIIDRAQRWCMKKECGCILDSHFDPQRDFGGGWI